MAAGYDDLDNVPTQTAGTSPVLASDWNTYVRDNFDSLKFGHVVVSSFVSLPSAAEGTMAYVADTNKIFMFNGSAWCEIFDLDNVVSVSSVPTLRSVPAGVLNPFAGSSLPSGWLWCDGSSVLRSDYLDLFNAIGTSYGSVDSTHFNVPDLRGRIPFGKGDHASVDSLSDNDGISTVGYRRPQHNHSASASSVGAHTHTAGTYPAGGHSHTIDAVREVIGRASGGSTFGKLDNGGSQGTSSVGDHSHSVYVNGAGEHSHTIYVGDQTAGTPTDVVPYIVTNYIIKF